MSLHKDSLTDSFCSEVLARHADYLDGLLPSFMELRVQAHLAGCGSCARYDRVVRKGMDLVRDLPAIQPSDDFDQRLQHRLLHVRDGDALAEPRAAAGAAAAFAVASMIALLAWSPMLMEGTGSAARTAHESLPVAQAVQHAMDAMDAAFAVPPSAPMLSLVSTGDWYPGPAAPLLGSSPVGATLASFPGPYSPLVVQPPVQRSARMVSSEQQPE